MDSPAMFKSLERWTCSSCQTINTAFEFYCVACNTPGVIPRDAPYIHIPDPIPPNPNLPFQDNTPITNPTPTTYPYAHVPADSGDDSFTIEDSTVYRPQPYNPTMPENDTIDGPSCFIPLHNDVYLGEEQLIKNIGQDPDSEGQWVDDPIPRPHAPMYQHEETVIMPGDYDYSFMHPQEVEQLHSIQAFFNNSLGVIPYAPSPAPRRFEESDEMRFSLTESAKYELSSRQRPTNPTNPTTHLYPSLKSITEREENRMREDLIEVSPASHHPDLIDHPIVIDDPPVPSPRKTAPMDTSITPPVPAPRRTPASSLTSTHYLDPVIIHDDYTHPIRSESLAPPSEPEPTVESTRRRKNRSILQASKLDAVSNEGKMKIEEITAFLKEQKINFIDPSFFPSPKSLFLNPLAPNKDMVTKVAWLRPGEIRNRTECKMKWTVFNHPNPADVYQGTLGNCWFLSALSVVAEKEKLIHNLVLAKEVNQQGIYQVRLCISGKWQVETIDDCFPCSSVTRNQIYSVAVRNQLWVCLIEKAAAKMYGCYEALNKGTLIEGLSTLTGAPCETLALLEMIQQSDVNEAKNVIWSQITYNKNSDYLMGASTGNPDISEDVYLSVGLSHHHAYAVLHVTEMEGNRLVCLRDPNGVSRWKGDWSNNSRKWTHEMRKKLIPGGEGGIFWISLDDLCNYFTTVDVCKVRFDYNEARESAVFPPLMECHSPVYLVEVFDKTEFDVSLYQPNRRFRMNEKKEHVMDYATEPTDLSVMILRTDQYSQEEDSDSAPNPAKLVGFIARKMQACVSHSFSLDKGHYLIVPQAFSHWDTEFIIPYTIATFSSKAHILESKSTRPGFFAECLMILAKTKGVSMSTKSPSIKLYKLLNDFNGALFAVENNSEFHFNVRIEGVNCRNLTSTRLSITTQDCVPPNHKQVLNIISTSIPSLGFSLSFRFSVSVAVQNSLGEYGSVCFPELTHKNREIHTPIYI